MGPKALAEQLDGQDILEEQAVEFMATFKSAYPDVQTYIEDIICNCRKQVSIKLDCIDLTGIKIHLFMNMKASP